MESVPEAQRAPWGVKRTEGRDTVSRVYQTLYSQCGAQTSLVTMPTAGMTDPEYRDLIQRIQVLHDLLDGVRARNGARPFVKNVR